MVNKDAQEWLNKNYPKWRRSSIKKLDLSNLNLEGKLDLTSFSNLQEVNVIGNPLLGKIVNNRLKAVIIIKTQEWLNKNYPLKQEVKKIEFNDRYGEQIHGELIVKDFSKLEEIEIWRGLTKLQIKNCPQLIKLEFGTYNNELNELNISTCPNLKELSVSLTKLNKLNVSACPNLKKLCCYNNLLSDLDLTNNLQLEELDVRNNNFSAQDLSFLSHLVNLKNVLLGNSYNERKTKLGFYNRFYGSSKILQNLDKLEVLDISGTDVSNQLEYLENFGGKIKKLEEVELDKKNLLMISPLIPPQLTSNKEDKFTHFSKEEAQKILKNRSYDTKEFNYDKLHLKQWKLAEPLLPKESPPRLYNIKDFKLESTKDNKESYAILSYAWGEENSNSRKEIEKHGKRISLSVNKALEKASITLEIINKEIKGNSNIKYLWVDQLCMNKRDTEEKSEEVPRIVKYYNNSTLTLIAIDTEVGNIDNVDSMNILKLIVCSEWFTRSWTYQEGFLSRQTIFMFDDVLIDGRAMAGIWALNQLSYVDVGKYNSLSEFQKGTKKIATPMGWVYYYNGYGENDKVEMTLSQALKAVKNRKRKVPVDGIYSILGLLPYGEQMEVNYSFKAEEALLKIMKIAVKNGYGEPLAWYGQSNDWMPQINKYGSSNVEGGIDVRIKSLSMDFREKGILLRNLLMYSICKMSPNLSKIEGIFEIEDGLYKKDVWVKLKDNKEKHKSTKVTLLGIKQTFNSTQESNILVVFDDYYYSSNKHFAMLVRETGEKDKNEFGREVKIYQRLGLVELGNGGDKLKSRESNNNEELIISSNFSTQQTNSQFHSELNKTIEVNPYQKY